MNCTMCGAIIPTGQTNCPMCGAPVQAEQPADNAQPVQPQMGYQQPMGQPVQPQMGYQQPQQPMGGYYQPRSNNAAAFGAGINGYLGYVKENPMNILKIVGAFFVFLATLIPWAHATYWGVTEHWNLFKAGGFNRFIAIIVLLLSLVLIAWEVADFIPVPQIANVKAKLQAIPYFEFILLGVIFVFVLIATIRHGYAHSDGTTVNFREYGIKVGLSAGVPSFRQQRGVRALRRRAAQQRLRVREIIGALTQTHIHLNDAQPHAQTSLNLVRTGSDAHAPAL